jgi:hypothetical protein
VIVKGKLEIGVRGSICVKVFIVGAGGPGGVSVPWEYATSEDNKLAAITGAKVRQE